MTLHSQPLKLGLQQRVLPEYRGAFLEMLGRVCGGGLGVFAGQPLAQEAIATLLALDSAQLTIAHNRYLYDPASPLFLCWQPGLIAWLESWQPQVLVVEANPRYLSTRQAVRWMHARRRPVLGWGLGAPPLRGPGWLRWLRGWERRTFLNSLDGLIAYSQRGAAEYQALGFPAGRVFTAYNAAAPRPTQPPPERPPSFSGRPCVLFVGRLQRRKRIDFLLQACAALPPALQPRLVIVGDGPDRAEMEAQAQTLYPGAEFTGAKRGAELAALFTAADLFVLPGTGGLAVQQALTYGLPVIVAQGDGTQDDLVRPQNGWLIPPDDLPALTQALTQALSDAARLRQMGAAGYRIVAEEVNLEGMVDVFMRAAQAVSDVAQESG